MRAVIQRVRSAKVAVNDQTVSMIGKGLCVLLGESTHILTSMLDTFLVYMFIHFVSLRNNIY